MKNNVLILLFLLTVCTAAFSQDKIKGYWLAGEGKSIVEIYAVDSDSYNGKIVWIENPTNKKGEPYKDKLNPDKNLQNRPILGIDMLESLEHNDGKWEGTIYVPKKGKTLEVILSLENEDRLKLSVSFRGFSRDQYWSKTELPK